MVVIGSDHAGTELKNQIIEYLFNNKIEYVDVTNVDTLPDDDYPDVAKRICREVLVASSNLGIAICGTGIGMSIACNKVNFIRAAICTDTYMAEMSRAHNNSNVLCLGARLASSSKKEEIINIVSVFLNTFYEGGRHDRRLQKIREIENKKI